MRWSLSLVRLVLASSLALAASGSWAQYMTDDAFVDALKRANPENAVRDRIAERATYERVSRELSYREPASVTTYRETTMSYREASTWPSPFMTTTLTVRVTQPVPPPGTKKCTCYLPENMRSAYGGPLTQSEIVDACWRQCF